MAAMDDGVGVVVIGRNEGERLRACLESLAGRRIVYVDSASTDGSVALARSLGAETVELDMSLPFSAARARNAGWKRLREADPDARWIQFVDGDCVVQGGWLEAGTAFLRDNPSYAAVSGRLRERFPERSLYNALCDLEWDAPVGDADAVGGIALYRLEAFEAVGGFDPTVVAGEEPELCLRLRKKGWKIRKLPDPMALHDADMKKFRQWWKRMVRGGYGGSDVAERFEAGKGPTLPWSGARGSGEWGGRPSCLHLPRRPSSWADPALESSSLRRHWPSCPCRCSAWPRARVAAGARTGYPGLRDTHHDRQVGPLAGQWRYARDRRIGRHLSLIEYRKQG
jgi:hypothetical protein